MKTPEEMFRSIYDNAMTFGSARDKSYFWFLKGLEMAERVEREEE